MSKARYQASLRAAVRGLWSGALDYDQAFDAMMSAIRRGITQAWNAGAAGCGIKPDELTPDERIARDIFIQNQFGSIGKLLTWVEQNRRGSGGVRLTQKPGVQSIYGRLGMWVNQYPSAQMKSGGMACGDEKRIWILGPTEHCPTCKKLAGKVKRYSFWVRTVMPRNAPNDKLKCGGYKCQCTLVRVGMDVPITRGPLPRLP